jgi:hypothetical protein
VLLGVLFTLWTAWWISLLVVFAQIANSFHHLPIMTGSARSFPLGYSCTLPSCSGRGASFLMALITVSGLLTAPAARLATVHRHVDLKPLDQWAAT